MEYFDTLGMGLAFFVVFFTVGLWNRSINSKTLIPLYLCAVIGAVMSMLAIFTGYESLREKISEWASFLALSYIPQFVITHLFFTFKKSYRITSLVKKSILSLAVASISPLHFILILWLAHICFKVEI